MDLSSQISKVNGSENIEEEIMRIIYRLIEENQIIDFKRIYYLCLKELNIDSVVILNTLENLQKHKRIFFGQKIIRDFILSNENRKKIFRFIEQNPGSRAIEIKKSGNYGSNLLSWNLSILIQYDCLHEVKIGNITVYGTYKQEKELILVNYFIRNEVANKILRGLYLSKMDIFTLSQKLEISYDSIEYQLKKMINENVILISLEQSKKVYQISEEYRPFIHFEE
jgi:predicted transcriptional regulator